MAAQDKTSFEEYIRLKKEVDTLYDAMMALHAKKARGFEYANARADYMAKKNLLQEVLEAHPEYREI